MQVAAVAAALPGLTMAAQAALVVAVKVDKTENSNQVLTELVVVVDARIWIQHQEAAMAAAA
jgi:hypothetical protein